MKKTVKINESTLKKIVAESVKNVLNESEGMDLEESEAVNLISKAYKYIQEFKASPNEYQQYAIWNMTMRLYWAIDKLKKQRDYFDNQSCGSPWACDGSID